MDKFRELNERERDIIENKGTEAPFTGIYNEFYEAGSYHCKRCDAKLYESRDKFSSGCGWPSFDDEVKGAVKRVTDKDGVRVEILCNSCNAHLGHVFEGEQFTEKNTRHCVNSLSLVFKAAYKKAYFAGGCFWGVEHLFQNKDGVISAVSGFMGGDFKNPSYQDVVRGDTGHLEVVEVTYDSDTVSFEELAKFFFEIHDPTQKDGQGPDVGSQYLSAVFSNDDNEMKIVDSLIEKLKNKGYEVVTKNLKKGEFFEAEEYHQDYYDKKGSEPYCHFYTKRF